MIPTTKRMTLGIMLALVAWGIYLSIGATGIFLQESLMDARKSVIVAVCVALFLGLWGMALLGSRVTANRDRSSNDGPPTTEARIWSKPGIATLACGVAGIACWAAAIVTWNSVSPAATTILGWLAAVLVMGAAISGIIALSDRRRSRGKWFGFLGLIGFAGALIGFVARMSP